MLPTLANKYEHKSGSQDILLLIEHFKAYRFESMLFQVHSQPRIRRCLVLFASVKEHLLIRTRLDSLIKIIRSYTTIVGM